jgi:hypothetical protein
MAVRKIEEPNISPMDINDWQKALNRTTFQGGGYIKLTLKYLNTDAAPFIARGSRFEFNSAFYEVTEDTQVNGSVSNNRWVFIYAKIQNGECVFEYGTTQPAYDAIKCAWFNGNDRAVAKMYKRADGYWGKVVLDDYDSMYKENLSAVPATAGTQVLSGAINNVTFAALAPGVYRYEVKGCTGGAGGNAGSRLSGGAGVQGEMKTGIFSLERNADAFAMTGGDGVDGGNGQSSSGGGDTHEGGGGGASGGNSIVLFDGKTIIAFGGSGGGGAGANGTGSHGGGGGGGGGGYGEGRPGDSMDGIGGRGGNAFAGGAGGAAGGSASRGEDGSSGINMFSVKNNNGGNGGAGYYGGTIYDNFGPGGIGEKSSSSGYAVISRLWSSIARQ